MKDFCKWLGVNEKIAKIVVWVFIGMAFLVMTNTMLESIGFPYYRLTVENLSKISLINVLDAIFGWIVVLLNFYSIVYLVFRIYEFKKIFKWSIVYLVFNVIITIFTNSAIAQIYIIIFPILFAYFYSNKNWKYSLYMIFSIIVNVFVQYIGTYIYKIKFINFLSTSYLNKFLISLDYFVIMFIIILIKEIVIKNKNNKRNIKE